MINFKKEIATAIAQTTNLDAEELENYIEIPPNSDLGDYAFPCFKLAKELRKAPPMIANDIKENIKIDENIIEKIDVVGGYLNIYINKETLANTVLNEVNSQKEKYGSSNVGQGKNVVILGRSNIVGKPLIQCMLQKNATVTVCHSKTENLKEITKNADILIAAIGKAKFVTKDMIKNVSFLSERDIFYRYFTRTRVRPLERYSFSG